MESWHLKQTKNKETLKQVYMVLVVYMGILLLLLLFIIIIKYYYYYHFTI